jgi:hypothetical protein
MSTSLISLEDAKAYLQVYSWNEDDVIKSLIPSATKLCAEAVHLPESQWNRLNSDDETDSLKSARETLRGAILFALDYLYVHQKEEADRYGLTLTLRSLLVPLRENALG